MKLLLFLLIVPLFSIAHPGIAIIVDSKNNIYYSDLKQVWKMAKGKRSIVVPNVHTHELYMDKHDNLYGEGLVYNQDAVKFYHFMWVLRPNGRLDTIMSMREAYLNEDYSLARDKDGNEYFIKQFLKEPDTNHIYKRLVDGREVILATGHFKGVRWLHPQHDGSLFYVKHNDIFRISNQGEVQLFATGIGNSKPTFKFSGNSITIWGVWQDNLRNVYVAVFSDQTVKKIQPDGAISDYFKSEGNWAPTHGVFDNNGQLWLLECSDKNEARVIPVKLRKQAGTIK